MDPQINGKKLAILIGFTYDKEMDYDDQYDRNYLPGIIVDLYQAYKQCLSAGIDNILIITDIEDIKKTTQVQKAMVNLGQDILNFIDTIKNNNNYHKYENYKTLIEVLRTNLKGVDHLFLYYSGHSHDGYILLPLCTNNFISIVSSIEDVDDRSDINKLSIDILRNIICHYIKYGTILIVMDCCNGKSLDLPYVMENEMFKFNRSPNTKFYKQRIINITSSLSIQRSVATRCGSLFSYIFFELLRNGTHSLKDISINIRRLCENDYNQTMSIYSSYPDESVIPDFIIYPSDSNIYLDNVDNILVIMSPNESYYDKFGTNDDLFDDDSSHDSSDDLNIITTDNDGINTINTVNDRKNKNNRLTIKLK